ncbi:hypothetical protein HKD37_17G047765 [Glycine soja]
MHIPISCYSYYYYLLIYQCHKNVEIHTSANTKTDDDREPKARIHTNQVFNHSQDLLMTPQKGKVLLTRNNLINKQNQSCET